MTDEPDSIVLRYLQGIDRKVDAIAERVDDLAAEMRASRTHMTGFMQDHARHDEGMASMRLRFDRTERRLEIQDPAE